jgi:hypothetical protein
MMVEPLRAEAVWFSVIARNPPVTANTATAIIARTAPRVRLLGDDFWYFPCKVPLLF